MSILTRLVNFRENVSALSGKLVSKKSPLNGKIKQISIHFPDGTNSLVEVKLSIEGVQTFPIDGSIALDNATPVFNVDIGVEISTDIDLEISNGDNSYSHTISVILVIVGEI